MEHRHDPSFVEFIKKRARRRVAHAEGCLHQMLARRQGQHTCSALTCRAVTTFSARTRPDSIAGRLGYVCASCGAANTCACEEQPANFAGKLIAKMEAGALRSVADADTLVADMDDAEAVKYGELRDEFLKAEQVRSRNIERVRKAAADERTSRGGEVVYFVGSEDGKVKIGTSAHMEKRLEALQTSSASRLRLLLTIPGGVSMETELHRRFAHLREGGEWFTLSDEIRHFVEGAAFFKDRVGSTAT